MKEDIEAAEIKLDREDIDFLSSLESKYYTEPIAKLIVCFVEFLCFHIYLSYLLYLWFF